MRKLIYISIIICLFFSISSNIYLRAGYIDDAINLNYWYEELDIDSVSLDYISFSSYENKRMFSSFSNWINLLREDIKYKYKKWYFDYYQTKWIITNYKNFIYYSNMFFYNKRQLELYPQEKEFLNKVLDSYNYMRDYYNRLKALIS